MIRSALVLALLAAPALAQAAVVEAPRGLTGEVRFAFDGPPLEARPQPDLSAPVLVRLERDPTDGTRYVARFLGSVEGEYDLRPLLQHTDGSAPHELSPLVVRVVSNLDDGMSTDLFDAADLEVEFSGRYRTLLWLGAIAWLAVPLFVLGRRMLRKPAEDTGPQLPRAPTLADQLRPLCEAAARRELSVHEQGRLELLLMHYWRERLGLDREDVAAGIRAVRRDDQAGELLSVVEGWLHRRDGVALDPAQLERLLARYRELPAASEDELGRSPAPEVAAR